MTTSAVANFDPYHKWLGIRDSDRPPNHYRLLGLELFETDPEIIEDAATRQLTHVRKFMRSQQKEICMQVLDELYTAKAVLLDRNQRATYDRVIKQQQQLQSVLGNLPNGEGGRNKNGSGMLTLLGGRSDTANGNSGIRLGSTEDAEACPECGWENPASRQFCSGCGIRLWESCVGCGATHWIREKHCGRCGLHHASAVRQRLTQAESKILSARSLADQYRLDEATAMLEEVAASDHPQLTKIAAEAKQLLPKIAQQRVEILDKREHLVASAKSAFEKGNTEYAATMLEKIPDQFRDEPVVEFLAQVRERQIEILSLKAEIRDAVASKQFDGLMPQVKRMLELIPNHPSSLTLLAKLEPYERKKAEKLRLACVQKAQELVGKHAYDKALAVLEKIPQEMLCDDDKTSLEIVRRRTEEVRWLGSELHDAVEWDSWLLPLCEQLLKFTPNDEKIRRYASTLQAINQRGGIPKVPAGAWPSPPAKSALGFPVLRMSEFSRIEIDRKQFPDFIGGTGGFCVAAGLALQGVRQGPMEINLLPNDKRRFFGMRLTKGPPKLTGHAAWGLDIGHSALKAVKFGCDKATGQVRLLAAERIEHSQPLKRATEDSLSIIVESLKALQAKHRLDDAPLCLGVSGQLAFSRFFQLPLMEEKKVAGVMQYEAASQIPFKLEDVVWDYQVLYRHNALRRDICEREMALFAIRHEHLAAAMAPLTELGLKPAIVQSQCAALHNLMAYDRLAGGKLPGAEDLRFDGLEPAVAVLDVGGEGCNLVISGDGASWCRCLMLGGQQFSQALVEANQCTFSQAEKWKRQPPAGANLYQGYQALQPAFNELAAEVRRSVEYYLSSDRQRRIVQMLIVGDGARLHGLLKHLWFDEG